MFGKFKKFLIWTFAATFFFGGFLALAPTQKAKADYAVSDLQVCSITSTNDSNNNAQNVSFQPLVITATQITVPVAFRDVDHGLRKDYVFNNGKFELKETTIGGAYGGAQTVYTPTYTFSSADFPASKLELRATGADNSSTTQKPIEGLQFSILNPNAGDTNYNNFAAAFNSKASSFTTSCVHSEVFGNGTFPTQIEFRGDSAPVLRLGGDPAKSRPKTVFQLQAAFHKIDWAPDDDIFYFKYLKDDDGNVTDAYKMFTVKVLGVGGNAYIAECANSENYKSCKDYPSKVVNISNQSLFFNHIYNSKADASSGNKCGTITNYVSSDPSDGSKDKTLANWTSNPNIDCLNESSAGWLSKWGISVNTVSITNPTGAADDTCGVTGSIFTRGIAGVLCSILRSLGAGGQWLIDNIFGSVFEARQPITQKLAKNINPFALSYAHAEYKIQESSIKKALDGKEAPWVLKSWKVILGLADVFIVIILLFLAIINILHIQYDTYVIKKTLPVLIIGIILANFSVFITKMFIDATNVLTATFSFEGGSAGATVNHLITALVPKDTGSIIATNSTSWFTLFIAIFFSFFVIVAFAILGFLFYVRYIVILALTVTAPLAFVLMAFPPTQGIFKQWWGWYAKFIFMKPISFFFIWLAGKVLESSGGDVGITVWAIVVFLVCAAILVPFKLGGAVMAGWGAFGKSISGTGKGGYLRKPTDEWWQRRKDKAGAVVKTRLPRLFAGAQKDREETEQWKAIAEGKVKQSARRSGSITQLEHNAQMEKDKLQTLVNDQLDKVRSGEIPMGFLMRMMLLGIKWEGGKPRIQDEIDQASLGITTSARLALSQKNVDKYQEDTTNLAALMIAKDNNVLKADLNDMLATEGKGIAMRELVDGVLKEEETVDEKTGERKVKIGTYSDVMQRATEYRLQGTLENDKQKIEAAQVMEQEATNFSRNNSEHNGKKINYNAWMDGGYAGRALSLTTTWTKEDSQVEAMNTPADELIKSIFTTGAGDRNIRVTARVIQDAMRGKRIGVGIADLRAYERLMDSIQTDIGRGSNADRATAIGTLQEEIAKKELYGKDSLNGGNRLGEELLNYAMTISENPALLRGSMAEQILAARRRGQPLPGTEDLIKSFSDTHTQPRDWTKENLSSHLQNAENEGKFNAKKFFTQHPEIFSMMGTIPPGIGMQDTFSLLNYTSDGISRLKILGGGGNPNNNIIAGSDVDEASWFKPLKIQKREDIETRKNEITEKETERTTTQHQKEELSSTEPTSYSSRVHEELVTGKISDPAQLVREYANAIEQIGIAEANILPNIKIDDIPINLRGFEQIANLISGTVAANIGDLQAKISQSFPNIKIDLPKGYGNNPEGIAAFQEDVRKTHYGMKNAHSLGEAAFAKEAVQYAPKFDKNVDDLKIELSQLTQAAQEFKKVAENMRSTNTPQANFPKEVMENAVKEISDKAQMVPLTKQILQQDPSHSEDILRKMILGWQGAIKAKEANYRLDEHTILQGILTQLKEENNTLEQFANQRMQPPTPPPASGPAAPSQGGQTPPTTPPGGGGILE